MLRRWMLSEFFVDDRGLTIPVCAAYGLRYHCPRYAEVGGKALVRILTSPQQVAAASTDPRVTVCPGWDGAPAPSQVIDAYIKEGAQPGMTMAGLIDLLASTEPLFEQEIHT